MWLDGQQVGSADTRDGAAVIRDYAEQGNLSEFAKPKTRPLPGFHADATPDEIAEGKRIAATVRCGLGKLCAQHSTKRPAPAVNGWSTCPDCSEAFANSDGSLPNCSDCHAHLDGDHEIDPEPDCLLCTDDIILAGGA